VAGLVGQHQFGQLITVDADCRPVVVPAPFLFTGDRVLLHLARPDPVWPAVAPEGRRTEYYTAVQVSGPVDLVADPAAKSALLREQLAGYGMIEDLAAVEPDAPPCGRMPSGIRGIVLHVREVRAKFKYDDGRAPQTQRDVAAKLAVRDRNRDHVARRQLLRRLDIRTTDPHPA
jgi:transcriptional regulator